MDIERPRALPAQEFLEPRLRLDQRQASQILTVQKQQIERKETHSRRQKQQIVEHGPAGIIDTCDLAVNNGILHAQILADALRQILEVAERVAKHGEAKAARDNR
jgi:hypothetical protein